MAEAAAKESEANVSEFKVENIGNICVGEREKTLPTLFPLAVEDNPLVPQHALLGFQYGEGMGQGWKRFIVRQFLHEMDGFRNKQRICHDGNR